MSVLPRPEGEQGDELAPLHVWMAPTSQEIMWRVAQRSLAVMCPAWGVVLIGTYLQQGIAGRRIRLLVPLKPQPGCGTPTCQNDNEDASPHTTVQVAASYQALSYQQIAA
jgi:hypothetical protein